jgi:superfamily II DNA/RNA helicase
MKSEILQTLNELGIQELNEIQKKAIPLIEEGKDVFVMSPTGSGKTFAYLIPAIERIEPTEAATKVLIIVPTRELAMQVSENAKKLSVRTGAHVVTLIGGMDITKQMNALRHRPQILIGTPGRIVDLIHQNCIDLSALSLLIFDEADQIISTGQREETEEIRHFISAVQTVCLSATENELTSELFPGNCENINMGAQSCINNAIETYYVKTADKRKELLHLLKTLPITTAIVFTNYKNDANDLANLCQQSHILASAFSSFFEERKRIQILKAFEEGKIRVLIATDAAARGLDITEVSHIIHYDIPMNIETWIHRSGRTAHQGNNGITITIFDEKEPIKEVGQYILDNSTFYPERPGSTDLSVPYAKTSVKTTDTMELIIRAGRKDKIRPGDLIGALCTVYKFEEIGVLEIQDTYSTVTILKQDLSTLPASLSIKGRKRKIELKRNA